MAFIRKIREGKYRVFYRSYGKQTSKTFSNRSEAIKFRDISELQPEHCQSKLTLTELLKMYQDDVSRNKRSAKSECLRVEAFMRRDFAQLRLDKLNSRIFQEYIETRVCEHSHVTGKSISPATIIREFKTLSAIFHWAIGHGFMVSNPLKGVRLPKEPPHRERIASEEDIEKLLIACAWDGISPPTTDTQTVIAAFLFSCRTGMRAGEILQLEESWIEGKVIHLPATVTKTQHRRDVALGKEAMRILNLVRKANGEDLFKMDSEVRATIFRKIRERANLGEVVDSHGTVIKEALHFHDGRATFATWAASPDPETGSPRLDVMALARQTGHQDLKMLMRYYRQSAEQNADRLK